MSVAEKAETEAGRDFIRDIVAADLAPGRHKSVVTRFPPEPNGYLHIGHAKSICLNFGIAQEFGGRCNLRFDDTNPTKEEQEYIDAIEARRALARLRLGRAPLSRVGLFRAALRLGRAPDPGRQGLCRRPVAGRDARGPRHADGAGQEQRRSATAAWTRTSTCSAACARANSRNGARVLRAKIDMASGNINLRDPVLYRILNAPHPRTGNTWRIYPSYDFAHGQSDAIEGITHSICTLEFEDHRPLYDWFIENLPVPSRPRQYEFARLNLTYTVLSKRVLTELVRGGHVNGWDDPRMPTLAGLRRRGVPPEALRDFVKRIGVAKANSVVDLGDARFLDPRGAQQDRAAPHGGAASAEGGDRELPGRRRARSSRPSTIRTTRRRARARIKFGRELYIERDDFMENPPKKFFRLSPGTEVRLRYAYFITCREVVKDAAGEVVELRCTYDPATRGGNAPDGRKVKATIHWVSAADSRAGRGAPLRSAVHAPRSGRQRISPPTSIRSRSKCWPARGVEPALAGDNTPSAGAVRAAGLFLRATRTSTPGRLVFNRTVGLRDSYAKVADK